MTTIKGGHGEPRADDEGQQMNQPRKGNYNRSWCEIHTIVVFLAGTKPGPGGLLSTLCHDSPGASLVPASCARRNGTVEIVSSVHEDMATGSANFYIAEK